MSKPKLTIIGLVVVLVASNAWWAYRLLDAGISQTYLGASLEDNKEALNQTLVLLPVVAQAGISRVKIISAARPAGDSVAPFEKDGFVWVGKIGLKFNNDGKLIEATRAWDPP